jgi:uncharacterized protein
LFDQIAQMKAVEFKRSVYDQIKTWLFQEKVIILYGARQVGKTTLSKAILQDFSESSYLNCERLAIKELLESGNLERIKDFFENSELVVLDEAQKISNIGLTLKLIHDTYPEIQLIATGSSSFELSDELSEPLTGRNIKFILYPLSLSELEPYTDRVQMDEKLHEYLRYGTYPEIVQRPENQKAVILDEITSDYLFRDVLKFENLKRPEILMKLLKALALQLGNEVSFRELSNLLKVSSETIQRYIELLEKSFVLFRLPSFSRNLRNELSRSHKYYFHDLGIRNSLIQNFLPLNSRNDTGSLWENFCIIERIKSNQKNLKRSNLYFWRTYQQKEIDLIEEESGNIEAFEFKWNPLAKAKNPEEFLRTYPGSKFSVITPQNYRDFILR